MGQETQSRAKLHELLETVREIDERRYGPEWGIESVGDIADGMSHLMHVLEGGLFSHFNADPERPVFRRIVSPTRKFRGDNSDAIYFDAAIRPDREYRVRGNMAGAVYVSITIEEGPGEGAYATGTAAGIQDAEFDTDSEGNFELLLSAKEPTGGRNWLHLSPAAMRITTRHYFEDEVSAAADPSRHVPISIEPLVDPGPPAPWTEQGQDQRVAAGIQRVINFIRGDTIEMPVRTPEEQPSWVSTIPNQFNPPEKPGDMAFAAMDIAYTMAPYLLGPDDALVITGRFPDCRFANVCLWNRYIQSYDFNHRTVSLNRAQTKLEADGSFRMVIAHRDPGVPNWLDTEGRPFGMVYWRFLLPEGDVETPKAERVPLNSLV